MPAMHVAGRLAATLVGASSALVLVALAVAVLLTPAWVAFEQDRSNALGWTRFTPAQLRTATDAILADLVLGPPDFDVAIDGAPVLTEAERSHMRDVRGVFSGFFLAALAAAAMLLGTIAWSRGDAERRRRAWRWVRNGALVVGGLTVVLGAVAAVAFDAAFEVFHRLFFAGGTYTFDPRTDRLVQLFPDQFWLESSVAAGALVIVGALVLAWWSGRRIGRATTTTEAASMPSALQGSAR